ncbi:MAG: SNF2 helicase associated domain-containing protein, partial [Lachnospiraceae bacterium]|nr:SNF2 helicase associated domain-containing protein [Lachnospiraceae bacterium]
DETSYTDGFLYYKNGRVISAESNRDKTLYRFAVKGNFTYSVSVSLSENDCSFVCNCSAGAGHSNGACKHVIAALLFLHHLQHTPAAGAEQDPQTMRSSQILNYYMELDDSFVRNEICHVTPYFYYGGMLRTEKDYVTMRISMGADRPYKVQAVKKMLENIRDNQTFVLGKDFKFRGTLTEMDMTSQRLISYLTDVLSMEEQYGITGEQSVFQKNDIRLNKRMFRNVLHILKNEAFTLYLGNNRALENVRFVEGNPVISFDIDAMDDCVVISYGENGRVFPLTADGDLLYYNAVIYRPDATFTRNYLPIYNSLSKENPELVFRDDYAKQFLNDVLPKLSDTMNVQIPENLKDHYLTFPLKAAMYLDYAYGNISAELRFSYGEYTFNSFSEPDIHGYILVRDKEKESSIREEIVDFGFEKHNGYYLLCDEDALFRFISGDRGRLPELCDLMFSDSFRSFKIRSGRKVSYGVHMNSGEDFLSLDISLDDVPKQELRDLLLSAQMKKPYYRLKDGDFLLLDSPELDASLDMLRNLNVNIRSMKDATVNVERNLAGYLKGLLSGDNVDAKVDESVSRFADSIREPKEFPIPERIRADVRPYQKVGYYWMKNLASFGMGGILADDMGLGKTLQSVMYLASLPEESLSIVICPSSLMFNWKDEIENFAPGLSCTVVCGIPEERGNLVSHAKQGVLITSYPLLRRDMTLYRNIRFAAVIIDEAQNIKNSTSLNAMNVKRLQADSHFALTGTPIENSLSEIWSIFDFLMPGYLFHHPKFISEYEKPILNNDEDKLAQLNLRIRPFILRRMKKDVLNELPDKTEEKILIDLSEKQKKLYAAYLEHYKGELNLEDDEFIQKNQIQILSVLMRLRQICCHPATFLDNYDGDSAKMELLIELLTNAIDSGHRVLVFSQFTSMLGLIREELDRLEIPYFSLEGKTKIDARNQAVKRFNEGEKAVFLISLKAGGTGLNLIGADTVIHMDPWWNPAVEEQATDRAYRIGQHKNVHVIKILAKGTIEEKIYRLQKRKQSLADSVIDMKQDILKQLTKEELMEIFS